MPVRVVSSGVCKDGNGNLYRIVVIGHELNQTKQKVIRPNCTADKHQTKQLYIYLNQGRIKPNHLGGLFSFSSLFLPLFVSSENVGAEGCGLEPPSPSFLCP